MTRICVNGLSVETGGGLVNLSGLLRAIAEVDSHNEYIVLAPEARVQHFITGAANFRIRPMHSSVRTAGGRVTWEQLRLPKLLAREGIDVLFSPANIAPLRLPRRLASVVKVQNIAPFSEKALALESGAKRRTRLRLLRTLTVAALRRADAAIFISNASAALLRRYIANPHVIYDGLTPFPQLSRGDARALVRERHGIDGAYVLCVADLYPHKNVETLVRGFALVPTPARAGTRLVLVGKPIVGDYAANLARTIEASGAGSSVVLIPGVSHDELGALYAGAAVYAFPSLVESGGTTLVEAMSAGLPIVASDLEPLREFCRNAALYCAPDRPGEWAAALGRALTDAELARTLGERGRERSRDFRWDEAARRTVDLFEAVAPR